MDKTAIKNFAIEARKILMKTAITEAGFYGITKDECKAPLQKGNDFEVYETLAGTENRIFGADIKRRANLVNAINELGFDQVIEETAYTWFNRIIAIRFMEVNNYLPTKVRVLSSETGNNAPDIISQADTVELNLTPDELEAIQTAKRENRYDDAFRLLFIKQCNELNAILPGLFEKTDDYMELLLKITYTSDGVVRMLVDSIPEDNFNVETEGQVEIIGWMYQYYNTELKDDTFAKLKKNVKITKERIPAATQLFTPDWIVRYMVENSLGRVWIEHLRANNPELDEKVVAEEFGWKYYLPEAEQEADVSAQLVEIRSSYKDLTPQDITCIDPCMGSGHILVYMFDVLMDIYRSEGFSERDSVFYILEKNIRGLDIDRRAYQLSYFALMMKARGYNRIFFRGHEDLEGNRVQANPKVYAIEESNSIDRNQLSFYGAGLDDVQKNNALNQMKKLLDSFYDAREFGSILYLDNYDWDLLDKFVNDISDGGQISLISYAASQSQPLLKKIVSIGRILESKYDAVVTNPPYRALSDCGVKLNTFAKNNYKDSKNDLSTIFMESTLNMTKKSGFMAMINIPVWMFIQAYKTLREKLLRTNSFINMAHCGRGIFGSDFGSTAFVIRKDIIQEYEARYLKLFEKASDVDAPEIKEERFLKRNMEYDIEQNKFWIIPSIPIGYWLSDKMFDAFSNYDSIADVAIPASGTSTGSNDVFLRLWYEIDINKMGRELTAEYDGYGYKWIPCNKGGAYRRWYGNFDYVMDWDNNGLGIRNNKDDKGKLKSRPLNLDKNFKEGLTWTKVGAGGFSLRYFPEGCICESIGAALYQKKEDIKLLLGFLNTKIATQMMAVINPTMGCQPGDVALIPVSISNDIRSKVLDLVNDSIRISKEDWDSFETSWNFVKHPLISCLYEEHGIGDLSNCSIASCYKKWEQISEDRFYKLKENEELLNSIFIKEYGLQNELEPSVKDADITIRKADLARDIKSLLSYAVGCMLGRYSIDSEGIVFAGGEFNPNLYKTIPVSEDGIILLSETPVENDIVDRFVNYIKILFGKETLEENLAFIASALGKKGATSRDIIRNYFLEDFFKDHCCNYSVGISGKRPIYWLFDSGKENAFKCLVYIHRYTTDLVGIIRSNYLAKTQERLESALSNEEYAINNSSSAVDKAQATKNRDKYIRQLAEIKAYYPALSHVALQRIELDLDDGVKTNYAKFQGIEVSIEGEKNRTVDLLAKI